MDKLYEAAKYYSENLEGRKFCLTAGKNNKLLKLGVTFGAEHFKHLIGLHKLKDIPVVNRKSNIVYRQILDKKTTFSDIKSSDYLSEMEGRLDIFNKMRETLFSPNLMLKSLKGYFKGIKADYLLSKNDDKKGNIHLFLKDNNEGITIPVTFFSNQDAKYITGDSAFWTVLSVEEIKREKENQVKQEVAASVLPQEKSPKKETSPKDAVASVIEICSTKINEEINRDKNVRQVKQVGQAEQAQQVGQVRQPQQRVAQKTKPPKNGGKR